MIGADRDLLVVGIFSAVAAALVVLSVVALIESPLGLFFPVVGVWLYVELLLLFARRSDRRALSEIPPAGALAEVEHP